MGRGRVYVCVEGMGGIFILWMQAKLQDSLCNYATRENKLCMCVCACVRAWVRACVCVYVCVLLLLLGVFPKLCSRDVFQALISSLC